MAEKMTIGDMETVRIWSSVPARKKDCDVLLKHFEKESNLENYQCWLAISEFKGVKVNAPQIPNKPDLAGSKGKAKWIFDTFIDKGAPKDVNISDKNERDPLITEFKKPNPSSDAKLFDKVEAALNVNLVDPLTRLWFVNPMPNAFAMVPYFLESKNKKGLETFYAWAKSDKDARAIKKDTSAVVHRIELLQALMEFQSKKTNLSITMLTAKGSDHDKATFIFKEFLKSDAKRCVPKGFLTNDAVEINAQVKKVHEAITGGKANKDTFNKVQEEVLKQLTKDFWKFVTESTEAISLYPMKTA